MARLLSFCLAAFAVTGASCLADEAAKAPVIVDEVPPGSVSVNVAPLELAEVTSAIYALTVKNLSGDTINSFTIDSANYGSGAGSATYVTPCDATPTEQPSTVSVTLVQLFAGNQPVAAVLPPMAVREVTCQPNTDTFVQFDFSVIRSAQQGFFDIKASVEDIFCSAKLDCQPGDAPGRAATVVLGFACGAGATGEVDTNLYMSDITITCAGLGAAKIRPVGDGYLSAGQIQDLDPNNLIASVRVYRGPESLQALDALYWNLSFDLTTWAALADCTLTAHATATDGTIAFGSGGTPPYATSDYYPMVSWNVPLTVNDVLVCTSHPVGGESPNDGVEVIYPANGADFENQYGGN